MLTHSAIRIAGRTSHAPRPARIFSTAISHPAKKIQVNISGREKKRAETAQSASAVARVAAGQPARGGTRIAAISSSASSAAAAAWNSTSPAPPPA